MKKKKKLKKKKKQMILKVKLTDKQTLKTSQRKDGIKDYDSNREKTMKKVNIHFSSVLETCK